MFAGGLACFDADFGLEPLAVFVHQAHDGNWRAANEGRKPRQVIETLLRVSVENPVTAQSVQPFGLVFGYWKLHI